MSNTIETNKVTSDVFNMDCVEYMRTLPDNHFDIAICDPPYGDAESGNFHLGGAVWRQVRPLQTADCDSTEATDGIVTSSHKLPPPINNKPTGIHTQGGTWATKYRRPSITPTEADSADIRGGYKLTANFNVLTGMLPHHRSSSMSFSA